MNVIDRLFVLRTTPPFDQLRESELVLIAAAVRTRVYAPGEVIGLAGRPLRNLFVVVKGDVSSADGTELPQVFGAVSLLFGATLDQTVRAGSAGATCLMVRRAHFHTILNECPGLVVGLVRGDPRAEPVGAA